MEDIQERSNGVARRLPNLGLLNQRVVEQRHGILLLLVRTTPRITALGLLPRRRAGDVEAHLGQLVPAGGRLPALARRRTILAAVGLGAVGADRELDGDLVAAGEVRVGDLRVGDLKGRPVLHAKRELGLAKLGLAPVPPAQRVLLVLEVGAVPALEDFAEALVVLSRY